MPSRKIAVDRLDRLWRNWMKSKGYGWADFLKKRIPDITGNYAMPMLGNGECMNYAYRAGFAEGLREAKRRAATQGVNADAK